MTEQELTEREEMILELAAERARRLFDPVPHIRLVKAVAAIGTILLLGMIFGWKAVSDNVDAIQQSRFELIRDSCSDQNDRNHETLLKLALVSHQGPVSRPLTRKERQDVDASKLLINAIIPARPDCSAYARARLSR